MYAIRSYYDYSIATVSPMASNLDGSIFTKTPVALSDNKAFSSYFKSTLTAYSNCWYYYNGSFGFVVQPNGNTQVGNNTDDYGYTGISNSIAVIFDIKNNQIKVLKNGDATIV